MRSAHVFLNHSNIADLKARDLYSPRSSWTDSAIIAGIAAVALFACAHTFANAEEASTIAYPRWIKHGWSRRTAVVASGEASGPGRPAFAVCVVNAEKPQ